MTTKTEKPPETTQNQLANPPPNPKRDIRDLLNRQHGEIAAALPSFCTPERFVRVALTTINKTPKLLECTQDSLLACLMDCAQLGLEPDNVMGRAYLIPYGNVCTLIIGYKGLIELAMRSGKVKSIMAQCVHEFDEFTYEFGLEPKLVHKPRITTERGKVVAVYAYAILNDGCSAFDVMSVTDIDKIKNRSKAKDSGPWKTDWNEMARKTVMKRLSKYLPLSVEFAEAVARDNEYELEKNEEGGFEVKKPVMDSTFLRPVVPAAAPEPSNAPIVPTPETVAAVKEAFDKKAKETAAQPSTENLDDKPNINF